MGTCLSSIGSKIKEIHTVSGNPSNDDNHKEIMTAGRTATAESAASKPLTQVKLQEYVQLEKSILNLERKNLLKKYNNKVAIVDELRRNLDQIEASYQEIRKQANIKYAGFQNLKEGSMRELFVDQGSWERRFEREQREYDGALKRQQSTEKELENKRALYQCAAKVADIFKQKLETLHLLYLQQDVMIAEIFGMENVTVREKHIREQLTEAQEWQQRIALAKFKWTNCRLLLVHAVTQMAFGISRWKLVEHIESTNIRARYFAASEARNNFSSASQNVASCRVYLGSIKFPCATEEEMTLLDVSIQNVYQDIQSNISLRKALTVYETTYRKIASILQWFDKVINDTILKDLDKAKNDVAKYQKQLREEHLERLLQKVRLDLGEEIDISADDTTISDENLTDDELLAAEQNNEQSTTDQACKSKNSSVAKMSATAKVEGIANGIILHGDIKRTLLNNVQLRQKELKRNDETRSRMSLSLQAKVRQRLDEARKRTATVNPTNGLSRPSGQKKQPYHVSEEVDQDTNSTISMETT